ncbi:electron transfer flavoprotein subunit alpha/FixB family protein [Chloroflexota bacterium]
MSDNRGVLILGEIEDGKLASITKELLGIGRKLADELGEGLSAILIGNSAKDLAQEAIACGADKVHVADNPALAGYNSDGYTAVATRVCQDTAPSILLTGQSSIGRDVAPRLAARLGVALNADCIELRIDADSKRLIQVRPVYGGNAVAEVVSKTTPQMATVRLKSMSPLEADSSRTGEIVNVDITEDALAIKARVVNVVKEEVEGIKLEDASVVVAGGAGVVGTEGWDLVKELAKVLGGAVGATRPPVEEGLISNSVQIGQTGKMIAPDLYIAVGISGAQQHMAGCDASKIIVAVNRDSEAEIFRLSDIGVVGDCQKILPALTAKCKELLS